jgi:hypothetical protein
MPKRIGMTLSICNYKKIYICIVVAQDFQVSDSSFLAITIIKQRVVVSFIKDTSTPTGLIIPVINNDLFLTVIQARIQKFFKGGFQGGSKTRIAHLEILSHYNTYVYFFVVTNR